MTQPEKQMTVEEERDLWKEIAVNTKRELDEVSKRSDEASDLLAVATAGITQLTESGYRVKPEPTPPAPPPPPVPVAPPPPRPSSVPALYALPAHERARVREAYPDIESELDKQFHDGLRIGNANRGGSESHRIGTFGENIPPTVAEAQAKARADLAGWQAGSPKPFFKGTQAPATVESLAAAMTASVHGGARPAPAPASAPAGKVRHVGGVRK
jgi:hypothetical protein